MALYDIGLHVDLTYLNQPKEVVTKRRKFPPTGTAEAFNEAINAAIARLESLRPQAT